MVQIILIVFPGILLESWSPPGIPKHWTMELSWLCPDKLGRVLLA